MNKLQHKLATATATGALLLNAALPAFAANYTFNISGNGSQTDNSVDFDRKSETGVFQNNDTTIVNDISVSSNTGGNSADDNTGADVKVETGDTEISATIANQASMNKAEVEACDCESETEVKISGNGTGSDSSVNLDNKHEYAIVQDNKTQIANGLFFEANTGDNDADDNTGGEVEIKTGDVTIKPVQIANLAGVNEAKIGSAAHSGDSSVDLWIKGNGSYSDNEVEIENETEVGIFQLNGTQIMNELYFGGYTGDNSASDNTGTPTSDPSIVTGDVMISAYIDNASGFNVAEADCGCVLDVMGTIEGNGTDSDSELELELEDSLEVAQDNYDAILNGGEVMSDTGYNDADDNTAGMVEVETGDTVTKIQASNVGGMNAFGDVEIDLPFGWNLVFGL